MGCYTLETAAGGKLADCKGPRDIIKKVEGCQTLMIEFLAKKKKWNITIRLAMSAPGGYQMP